MATYAIVHSTVSCMLRRVIADDDGNVSIGTNAVICTHAGRPDSQHPLLPGESAFVMPVSGSAGGAATPVQWKNAIKAKTGITPPDLVCALIDQNVVAGLIAADPDVDAAPDSRTMVLCYSPLITVGCSYDPASGLFSTAGGTLPAGSPGNSTGSPITIPPATIPKP